MLEKVKTDMGKPFGRCSFLYSVGTKSGAEDRKIDVKMLQDGPRYYHIYFNSSIF